MNRRDLISAAFLLVLGACAGTTAGWHKAAMTDAQLRADSGLCRSEANKVAGRDIQIDQDIAAARHASALDVTRLRNITRQYKGEARYNGFFDACMRGHGYSRNANS